MGDIPPVSLWTVWNIIDFKFLWLTSTANMFELMILTSPLILSDHFAVISHTLTPLENDCNHEKNVNLWLQE